MNLITAKIGGVGVSLSSSAVSHGKTFLDALSARARDGLQLRDNLRLPLGFSHLVLRAEGSGFVVHELNYAGNPLISLRKDCTTTLALHADMLAVCAHRQATPSFPHFMDRVRASENFLHQPKLALQRDGHGWIISGEKPAKFNVRLYELLGSRPTLLTAMALPVGAVVHFDGDQVANPH